MGKIRWNNGSGSGELLNGMTKGFTAFVLFGCALVVLAMTPVSNTVSDATLTTRFMLGNKKTVDISGVEMVPAPAEATHNLTRTFGASIGRKHSGRFTNTETGTKYVMQLIGKGEKYLFTKDGVNYIVDLPDPAMAVTQYAGYKLVWNDEFSGTGAPDSAKWVYEHGYVRNNEPQLYVEEQVWQEGGMLVIEAKYRADSTLVSASIETRGKADFLYGKIQAKIKIPVEASAWPAFWTVGTTGGWPAKGEVDIMEYYRYGKDYEPTILGNAFWSGGGNTGTVALSHFTDADPDWADKFHIWTADWDENEMKIYVDDYLVNTIDITKSFNRGGPRDGANPLREPQILKLNLALRGRGQDPLVPSVIPMKMLVDWVRVYQAE